MNRTLVASLLLAAQPAWAGYARTQAQRFEAYLDNAASTTCANDPNPAQCLLRALNYVPAQAQPCRPSPSYTPEHCALEGEFHKVEFDEIQGARAEPETAAPQTPQPGAAEQPRGVLQDVVEAGVGYALRGHVELANTATRIIGSVFRRSAPTDAQAFDRYVAPFRDRIDWGRVVRGVRDERLRRELVRALASSDSPIDAKIRGAATDHPVRFLENVNSIAEWQPTGPSADVDRAKALLFLSYVATDAPTFLEMRAPVPNMAFDFGSYAGQAMSYLLNQRQQCIRCRLYRAAERAAAQPAPTPETRPTTPAPTGGQQPGGTGRPSKGS